MLPCLDSLSRPAQPLAVVKLRACPFEDVWGRAMMAKRHLELCRVTVAVLEQRSGPRGSREREGLPFGLSVQQESLAGPTSVCEASETHECVDNVGRRREIWILDRDRAQERRAFLEMAQRAIGLAKAELELPERDHRPGFVEAHAVLLRQSAALVRVAAALVLA